MHEFGVSTRKKEELVDITGKVDDVVRTIGAKSGVCTVFVPHTTAGATINEGADPNVARDILLGLRRIVPDSGGYAHAEGNSAAHIKASLVGSSVSVPVKGGRLALGRWQAIFFAEFDGPRERKVRVSVVAEESVQSI